MMREKTIEKIIRDFIAKELTMSPEKIGLEDNLVNDLHADSMDIVNVVTAIESRFKIKFPDDTQIPYEGYTLQFLVEGVQKALREKSPVRKAARAAKNAEKMAEEKTRRARKQIKEKVEELQEKVEELEEKVKK
ncbi:MAG: acyl carrier protein [Bacteroidaceae bacterium]|nr:acyl carrier protein [Bacteroidaceae bacterium]